MKPILTALMLLLPFSMVAQHNFPSRINIGINLAPLAAGTPDLQAEYFFNRFVGATFTGGATLRPLRGPIKVDDNIDVKSLNGVYWKVGLKGMLPFPKKKLSLWLQVMYIGSQYNEEATRGISVNSSWDPNEVTKVSGMQHGFAVSPGIDIYLNKYLDVRAGYQVGYFKRDYSLGGSRLNYQPGFGNTWFAFPEQLVLGLNYRIGNFTRTEKE
ncbi:MAG: hypothetical protein H6551_05465 [Chitinophagales bacterium]|nr:hypothetical protein [Chitinophagaceae bacterium]MCB9064578.1 hypothetical protein [Chitinophagales bacterium]